MTLLDINNPVYLGVKLILVIFLTPLLCFFILVLLIGWFWCLIIYTLYFLSTPFHPLLISIGLWIHKRLIDYNCYNLLYYLNNDHHHLPTYIQNQGNVDLYLKLFPVNINSSIKIALNRNQLLFFKNALSYISDKEIIKLYKKLKTQKAINIILSHLSKQYTVKLFLNQLTYELNDIKPIIYHYYIQLMIKL